MFPNDVVCPLNSVKGKKKVKAEQDSILLAVTHID
jgi:hypothetical protein